MLADQASAVHSPHSPIRQGKPQHMKARTILRARALSGLLIARGGESVVWQQAKKYWIFT
jgi:hypothetical protein